MLESQICNLPGFSFGFMIKLSKKKKKNQRTAEQYCLYVLVRPLQFDVLFKAVLCDLIFMLYLFGFVVVYSSLF